MHKIKYLFVSCIAGLIGLLSLASIAHAETHITNGYQYSDAHWTAQNSPYILEDQVTIPQGLSLIVDPGVSIIASSSLGDEDVLYVQGDLDINGTKELPVSVSGSGSIGVYGTTSINYANITVPDGINVNNGFASIASSTISGAGNGVYAYSANIQISGSKIQGNNYGIFVDHTGGGIFQVRADSSNRSFGTGGIGNALPDDLIAQALLPPKPSSVTVTDSEIIHNTNAGIQNSDSQPVEAINNWWGSSDGPGTDNANPVYGLVDYTPWKDKDPDATTSAKVCCSSVLFIPGMEGSRLYKPDSMILGIGSMTNRLWEPNSTADVKKLYLDSSGSSTDMTIYAGGPIDKALWWVDVYGKFMKFLDGLSADKTITEWKAFGYNWRKPIAEVVAGREQRSAYWQTANATTSDSLLETVNELAAKSKTGKVTIIAHSNGGLVAKELIRTLASMGEADLIDLVISVAVPYLGTPEAIVALLHGDDQALGYGFIATPSTMRNLGVNMASAYSLLPSKEYFSHVFGPTIAFASTTVKDFNDGSYPQAINSVDAQSAFIANLGNGRTAAASADTTLAINGNQALLAAADVIHGILDPFSWPATIGRWAVIGWNVATTKSVTYSERDNCPGYYTNLKCNHVPTHYASTTIMGDGTVVAPSAAANSGTAVSMDLKAESQNEHDKFDHVNILESSTTQAAIKSIIVHQDIAKLPGVTLGEPDYSKEPVSLVVSTHSPVELNIYDAEGNHTGPIPTPPQLAGNDFIQGMYESKIPGSKYTSSESVDGHDSYIYLPDDLGKKYSVVVNGTNLGFATLDVQKQSGGTVLDSIEYSMYPVTPMSVATTSITNDPVGPDSSSLASSTPPLAIDLDADGTPDIMGLPNSGALPDATSSILAFKKMILALSGSDWRGAKLIQRVDRLFDRARNGKAKKGAGDWHFDDTIGHLKIRGMAAPKKKQLLDLIERMIARDE